MLRVFSTLILIAASLSYGANYRITIETLVGGKLEDKFSFEMADGTKEQKGFEGRMLAKRYRIKGFDHPALKLKEQEKLLDKLLENNGKEKLTKKPIDAANERLAKLERTLRAALRRIESMQEALTPLKDDIKELETLIGNYDRNRSTFGEKYLRYIEQKEPPMSELDIKQRKAALYAKQRGEAEEFNVGSYCEIEIAKANATAVSLNLTYAYSRLFSWFYTDGNNNGNTTVKFPIFETFEKFDVKALTVFIGKPYCFQFARPALDGSKSMSTATEGTMLAGMGKDEPKVYIPSEADNALNAEGPLSEILQKFKFDAGKTVRVIISVKKLSDQ